MCKNEYFEIMLLHNIIRLYVLPYTQNSKKVGTRDYFIAY